MNAQILLAVSVAILCDSVAGAASRTDFVDYEVDLNEIPVDEIPFKIETDYISE